MKKGLRPIELNIISVLLRVGIVDLIKKGLRLLVRVKRGVAVFQVGIVDLMKKGLRHIASMTRVAMTSATVGIVDLMKKGLRLRRAVEDLEVRRRVGIVDLMKKGLRLVPASINRVLLWVEVGIVDLMKKGLRRPTGPRTVYRSRSWNRRPDEEGIETLREVIPIYSSRVVGIVDLMKKGLRLEVLPGDRCADVHEVGIVDLMKKGLRP